MDLLVLFGPPAAGKMTVGRALVARSRYRLFHNHMTIEPLLGLFAFDDPAFQQLRACFRRQILEACLAQDQIVVLPGRCGLEPWRRGCWRARRGTA
jgi:shikimate kinase